MKRTTWHGRAWGLAALVALGTLFSAAAFAQQAPAPAGAATGAQWIWAPLGRAKLAPAGQCFFRRSFRADGAEGGYVQIVADDRYELYVNGQRVGGGAGWQQLDRYDISRLLTPGVNSIAIRVQNDEPGDAGVAARVIIERRGQPAMSVSTDASWRVTTQEISGWQRTSFNHSRWSQSHSLGALGQAAPWRDAMFASADVAAGSGNGRFTVTDGFRVEQVVATEEIGPLTTMAFNEWGEIIAARERGPLMLVSDADHDGIPEKVSTLCELVKNSQGILPLNGELYVVGDAEDGAALYRLTDTDLDGKPETVRTLVKFRHGMTEHGPHQPVLGPDGLIYVTVGNHSGLVEGAAESSPYRHMYEGDLVGPRMEDAGGHAVGIKAPGGFIVRTDAEGTFAELYAGGLRNVYDIAFNREGELLAFDSDMEWDEGLPWYRPNRILHVIAGGEYGWRSGWAKWPEYYLDSLPAVIDTGRGSPTGLAVYDHFKYPPRYHNAVFACDWSRGRILAVQLTPHGASYRATSEVFLEGRPLNVTDAAIGPDGWLYFCTGGRDTEGGIYRVVYTGNTPTQPKLGGIAEAIRQPQLGSAWARQRVAAIQQQMGAEWDKQLTAVAENPANRPEDRARALELMQLFGPFPTTARLTKLAGDSQPLVRRKAAWLLGIHATGLGGSRLVQMLGDPDPAVCRQACQALAQGGFEAPVEPVVSLVGANDPYLALAARRLLEDLPTDQWRGNVLQADHPRTFLMGATALLAADPDRETVDAILTRGSQLMQGYLSDDDFIDLLRVFQLALHQGQVAPEDVPDLKAQLCEEYPSSDWRMNRELMRLLAYLQGDAALDRMIAGLADAQPDPDAIHVALYVRAIRSGWTTEQKITWLEFMERARQVEGGHSMAGYLENASRDFFARLTREQQELVLSRGTEWPAAALSVLAATGGKLDPALELLLIDLDTDLVGNDTVTAKRLRTGIVAVLGSYRGAAGMQHLRDSFENEPERRGEIAMGLAQQPDGANWELLVRSLPVLEGMSAQEVLSQLCGVEQKSTDPEALRQTIIAGLRLADNGGDQALRLLAHWNDEPPPADGVDISESLATWQKWYAEYYPDHPPAELPVEPEGSRWTMQEVLDYLAGDGAHGSSERGEALFEKAQCAKCHRFGSRGDGIGPDLSTVSQRFQRREILESVLFPSHVISDQYASKTVVTSQGLAVTGLVGAAGDDAIVVLQSNGEKVQIASDDVEQVMPNPKSAMPEGLLDQLSLEEIADLFAYLNSTTAGLSYSPPDRSGSARRR